MQNEPWEVVDKKLRLLLRMVGEDTVTKKEFCRIGKISYPTLRRKIENGEIQTKGNKIPRSELLKI